MSLERKEIPTGSSTADVLTKGLGEIQNVLEEHRGQQSQQIKEMQEQINAIDSSKLSKKDLSQLETQMTQITERLDRDEVARKNQLEKVTGSAKSYGELVAEMEEYKQAQIKHKGRLKIHQHGLSVKSPVNYLGNPLYRKDQAVMGFGQLGPLRFPFQSAEITRPNVEFSAVAQLLRVEDTLGADKYEYRKETEASRLGYVRSTLAAPIVSGAGADATFVSDGAAGFTPGTKVRIFSTPDGLQADLEILSIAGDVVTFTANLNFNADAGDLVTSENYGSTAEEASKPHGHYAFEIKSQTVQTLATIIATTQQRMNSISGLDSLLREEMAFRHLRNMSYHILYGDLQGGETDQLNGWANEPGLQTYLWSSGQSKDTRADAIQRAADEIFGDLPLTVIMNKRDWTALTTLKANDDHYVQGSRGPLMVVDGGPGARFLGPYAVVFDGACKQGDFFLVALGFASLIASKGDPMFSMGFINDDWAKNIVRSRYEQEVQHVIRDVTAYVLGQWDSQPA